MTAKFTELTKVQMPAIMYLTRLEYTYAGKFHDNQAGEDYDPDTNILIKIFKEQFERLNPEKKDTFNQVLKDIKMELDNDDLGRSFYNRLVSVSPSRLIDFEHPNNNVFHCTAEFT